MNDYCRCGHAERYHHTTTGPFLGNKPITMTECYACYFSFWPPRNSVCLLRTEKRRFHTQVNLNKQRPTDGVYAKAFGLTFGYWPCVYGPFVQLRFWKWRISLWWGMQGSPENLK